MKCVAYRTNRLEFFDEFYDKTSLCEDIDLCTRVRKIGYKLLLNTKIKVLHLAHMKHISEKTPKYTTPDKLLSMHENLTYFHLKCRYYRLAEINLLQILLSGIYRSLLAFLRSVKYASLRRIYLNDFYAAILGLKTGVLKYRSSKSLHN